MIKILRLVKKILFYLKLSGLLVLLLLTLPFFYYYLILPSEAYFKENSSLSDSFKAWPIPHELNYPSKADMPPPAFFCALCYSKESRSDCKDAKSFPIARSLYLSNGQARMGEFHLWTFYLTYAVEKKYGDETLSRLYLPFSASFLPEGSFSAACEARFHKPCAELTPEEAIRLQLWQRQRHVTERTEKLYQEISKDCLH